MVEGGTPSSVSSPSAVSTPSNTAAASPAAESCKPSGTTLHLTAENTAFDTGCLAAKGGQDFAVKFVNKDSGVPHNMSIYTDSSATKNVYQGKIITGPASVTYKVPALSAGSYYFRCDVHPTQMFGTFNVK